MSIDLLSKANTNKANTKSEITHYHYIDALRGLAILGVFIIHSSQRISDMPERFYRICSFGGFGVQLFFILSALTLLLSFHGRPQEKQTHLRNFYIRRFFRIAPLFWAGLILYNYSGLHPNYSSPGGMSWGQIFATAAFVHGWYPTYINSAVPGGWSIAVETTFYAIFPILAVWLIDRRRVWICLFLVIILGNILNHFLYDRMDPFWQGSRAHVLSGFMNWWFPSQFPVFLVGFLLYFRIRSLKETAWQATSMRSRTAFLCVFGSWALIALMIHGSPLQGFILGQTRTGALLSVAFAAAFALLVYGLALVPYRLFVNRFFCYLGLISFSGYIDHFFVLDKTRSLIDGSMRHFHITLSPLLHYGIFITIALPSTIALATMTYRFIEQPGIALGKKLIAHLDMRHAALTTSSRQQFL